MIKKKELIKLDRLTLHPYRVEDRDRLYYLLTNEKITKTFMVPDFETKKEYFDLIDKLIAFSSIEDTKHLEYGIYLDDLLIGFVNDCGFDDEKIEIGYVIDPEYQSKGFATEAVKSVIKELFDMNYSKVVAGYFEGNIASKRVLDKCGMKTNGATEIIEYKGKEHNCFYMEIEDEKR